MSGVYVNVTYTWTGEYSVEYYWNNWIKYEVYLASNKKNGCTTDKLS